MLAAGSLLPDATRLLLGELNEAENDPDFTPRVVVLYGATGRGKTYAVQRFYDELCQQRPGYWRGGLTPEWPPHSTSRVNIGRKRIAGQLDAAAGGALPFFWLGVESYAYGRDPSNPSPSASQQLYAMFNAALTRGERQRKITTQVYTAALDLLATLVFPQLGAAKTLYDHVVAMWSIARASDELVERRRALNNGFVAAAHAGDPNAPMIAVIDDAQDIDAETLYFLSGLVAPDADPDDASARFLPARLGHNLAAPLLIVCTAWEHRIVGAAYRQPFRVWLDELEAMGIPVGYYQCEEFDPGAARSILDDWPDVPERVRAELLEHVTYTVENAISINPLVLSLGVAKLEERRDPFSLRVDPSADDIAALPTTPAAHIEDRLEEVRGEPYGNLAIGLLELCAALGVYSLPVRYMEFAAGPGEAGRLTGALELLDGRELAIPAWDDGCRGQRWELRSYRFDVDVTRHLSMTSLTVAMQTRLIDASLTFCKWVYFELLKSDFTDEVVAEGVIDSISRPMASVVAANIARTENPDIVDLARLLTGEGAPDPDSASAQSVGFAFARGALGRMRDDTVLAAVEAWWPSRIGLRIAERRLTDGVSDLDAPTELRLLDIVERDSTHFPVAVVTARVYHRHKRLEQAVDLLQPHTRDKAQAASIQSACYEQAGQGNKAIAALDGHDGEWVVLKRARLMAKFGRKDDAVGQLESIAAVSESAAIALAQLVGDRNIDRAANVLAPYLDGSSQARATLAQFVARTDPDRALELLGDDSTEVSARLAADLHAAVGRHDDEMRALARGAERSANLAIRYAEMLIANNDEMRAIEVLRRHAMNADNAAVVLATIFERRGDTASAIEVLRPVAGRFRNSATRLAGYLQRDEPDEAVRLLSLFADNHNGYRHLVLMLLRCGRADEALAILDGRLKSAKDRRARVLRVSAYFLIGDLDAGRRDFTSLDRNPTMSEYYQWAVLFASRGRVDLMAELLHGGLLHRDRVVADFTLSAAVNVAPVQTLGEICDQLWPVGQQRQALRHRLIDSLWAWIRHQPPSVPEMNVKKALSCCEVVVATGDIPQGFRIGMLETLRASVESDPKTIPTLRFFAGVSPFARSVLKELDLK
jgi:tetratricopeptide (TPR) repeat protein